ncbi:unnamed protein product, partial [Choristocarpus tenellus]
MNRTHKSSSSISAGGSSSDGRTQQQQSQQSQQSSPARFCQTNNLSSQGTQQGGGEGRGGEDSIGLGQLVVGAGTGEEAVDMDCREEVTYDRSGARKSMAAGEFRRRIAFYSSLTEKSPAPTGV